MRVVRLLALSASLLFAPAFSAGANSHPPALSVSAWPARVIVSAPGSTTVHVGNPGRSPVSLIVRSRGYSLDALGRPRFTSAWPGWLSVWPARLVVHAHAVATVKVTVNRPRGARAGDHAQLLLLSTQPPAGHRVVATLRIGIVVVARVPGRLIHDLAVAGVRAQHHGGQTSVEVAVANRGNMDEWLGRGRVLVTLARRGTKPVTVATAARRLLARTSGVVIARFRRQGSARAFVVVAVRRPRAGVALLRRRFPLRL
jgi:hypothetical protein